MDYTNCSSFYGTDQLFEPTPIGTCDSSLFFLGFFYSVLCLMRSATTIKKLYTYCYLRDVLHRKPTKLSLICHVVLAIGYTLFLPLFIFNVINVFNGFSFSYFTFIYMWWIILFSASILRTIRLGAKLGIRTLDFGVSSLERLDFYGSLLAFFGFVSIVLTCVVLVFLSPIFPAEHNLFGGIGFASKGVFQMCATLIYIWQIERVLRVIRARMPEGPKKIAVLKRLKAMQIVTIAFGFGFGVFYVLLGAHIFLWYWWTALGLTVFAETVASFISVFLVNYSHSPAKSSKDMKSNNDQIQQQQQQQQQQDDVYSGDVNEQSDNEQRENESVPSLSLGIISKRFNSRKKKKYKPKISRVTEVTEVISSNNVGTYSI